MFCQIKQSTHGNSTDTFFDFFFLFFFYGNETDTLIHTVAAVVA